MFRKILLGCLLCGFLASVIFVYQSVIAKPGALVTDSDAEQRQRGNRKRQRDSDNQKRRKVKLTGQLDRAQLSPTLIAGLQKFPGRNRAYTIKGNVVTPKDGFSIWQTADGDTAILDYRVKGGGGAAIPSEMYVLEVLDKDGKDDVYVSMCCCPGKGGNDECTLEGEGGQALGRCAGPDCCAQTVGWIDGATGNNTVSGPGCY